MQGEGNDHIRGLVGGREDLPLTAWRGQGARFQAVVVAIAARRAAHHVAAADSRRRRGLVVVSHRFGLSEGPVAYELSADRSDGVRKILLDPTRDPVHEREDMASLSYLPGAGELPVHG
ncbi:hypothetical protein [Streptomyces paradoxus]|uniref:hypothetical protein n=1 Tax=Streptomyces paradoxus TaxID=66375 RepID=UPI00382A8210